MGTVRGAGRASFTTAWFDGNQGSGQVLVGDDGGLRLAL